MSARVKLGEDDRIGGRHRDWAGFPLSSAHLLAQLEASHEPHPSRLSRYI